MRINFRSRFFVTWASPRVAMHLRAKRGANIFVQYGNIRILRNSTWPPSAILSLLCILLLLLLLSRQSLRWSRARTAGRRAANVTYSWAAKWERNHKLLDYIGSSTTTERPSARVRLSTSTGLSSWYVQTSFVAMVPICLPILCQLTLERRDNYNATSNDMKVVHWPLMDGLLHLVQWRGDWAGPQPAQAPPRCTKCNSSPINGQCTNRRIDVWSVALRF